jgi:hypothetical protein
MTRNFTNEPRPWVVGNGAVDEPAILDDFGASLEAAATRCYRAADLLRVVRDDADRRRIETELRGFLRRTIGAVTVAYAVLGDELPGPLTDKETP